MKAAGLVVVALAACGPGLAEQRMHAAHVPRSGTAPPADEAGIRRLLGDQPRIANAGLWFPDAACTEQFGTPGPIARASFDALAHCLGMLHWRPSGRGSMHDDTTVMTYAPGFELEVRVVGGRLDFVGYSGRGDGVDDTPMITPAALEALRTAGDPHATLTAAAVAKLAPHTIEHLRTHVRVCVAKDGTTTTTLGDIHDPEVGNLFGPLTDNWRFTAFATPDGPIAACALVAMTYPAGESLADDRVPLPPVAGMEGGRVAVPPQSLEAHRIAGEKLVVPDVQDKVAAERTGLTRTSATFQLCVDEAGAPATVAQLSSSGLAGYDAKLLAAIHAWRYTPYVVMGKPVPVCTVVTFIYSQG